MIWCGVVDGCDFTSLAIQERQGIYGFGYRSKPRLMKGISSTVPIEGSQSRRVDMQISIVSDSSETTSLWDNYVKSHPLGSCFHLMAWQRFIHLSFGHRPMHLVARQAVDEKIIGVLPLFLVRSRIFGRLLVSTPQAAYGGILAESDSVAESILTYVQAMAVGENVQFLELRNFRNGLNRGSLITKDLYVTFRQELSEDPEKTLAEIPRKTRAEIREGIRNGLEFRADGVGVDEFFKVYSQNVRDLGTPVFARQVFANGFREFGGDCKIFSVHWKGKLVAAVWTLFYGDEVIPYYGGSLREYNRLAVNNFMYWMLMKYGAENGYRIFDFGRSKKGTGSFAFKKRWGMTMTDLPYQYTLVREKHLPDTSPLNRRFAVGISVWRRLPLCITNSVGPLISRHLI